MKTYMSLVKVKFQHIFVQKLTKFIENQFLNSLKLTNNKYTRKLIIQNNVWVNSLGMNSMLIFFLF